MLDRARQALPSIASVALAVAVCFVAIAVASRSLSTAADAYLAMLWGGLGDWPRLLSGADAAVLWRPLGEASIKAALLTFTGLSVAVAFRLGLFNIGAQGQLMVGALASAVVGAQLSLPAWLHVPLCLLAAAGGAGLYGLFPAWLKVRRGVHEVISTIMLNWIAVSLIENWLVVGPLRATAGAGHSASGTDEIAATAALPRLFGDASRLNLGFVLAMAAALAVWLWLQRTSWGFQSRAVGLNADAARGSGIPVERRIYQGMFLAGALAGLAGAVLVMGTEMKFPATLGAPYGFDGIAIALVGQTHPAGVFASAVAFGALRAGGTRMQLFGVHQSFPELIQGLSLLFVAAQLFVHRFRRRKAAEA